jgi:RNA polymerase sigma factor (sigma-70 family)
VSCLKDDDTVRAAVAAAAAGDEAAWAMLVLRFEGTIRAVARRHRLPHADQDEVVQRTWGRLVESIGSIRDPAAIGGWLATTARRECLRLHRDHAREVLDDHVTAVGEQGSADEVVIAAERSDALHRALDRLPGRQRALLWLHVTHPALDYRQIGGALGMPVGSIGPTRGRSFARLRRDAQLLSALSAA